MKICLLLIILAFSIAVNAQEKEDSKIIVTVTDTAALYNKVRLAFIKANFIVRDLDNPDTIRTYSKEMNGLYVIGMAVIKNNIVTITGRYGLKNMDAFGFTNAARSYKPVLYFKASKAWPSLKQTAVFIGEDISYEK